MRHGEETDNPLPPIGNGRYAYFHRWTRLGMRLWWRGIVHAEERAVILLLLITSVLIWFSPALAERINTLSVSIDKRWAILPLVMTFFRSSYSAGRHLYEDERKRRMLAESRLENPSQELTRIQFISALELFVLKEKPQPLDEKAIDSVKKELSAVIDAHLKDEKAKEKTAHLWSVGSRDFRIPDYEGNWRGIKRLAESWIRGADLDWMRHLPKK